MERAFEYQKCIEVSLVSVYNDSLVLKTEEESLSKTATFLTSANETPTPPPPLPPPKVESTLSVTR